MFIFKGSYLYLLLYISYHSFKTIALKAAFFWYAWESETSFYDEKFFKIYLYIRFSFFFFFLSKKQQNWFFKIFHNSGMVELRKPATAPWIVFFISLSICLQYILSFEWSDFGLKCLVTVMLKGQSPMVRICLCNIPISEIVNNTIQFLGLLIKMELPWNSKER